MGEIREIFGTYFSSGPLTKLLLQRTDLSSDAFHIKVRLGNYSKELQYFLTDLKHKFVHKGGAYPNHTSEWAFEPLLVQNCGPTKFLFTVERSPVKKFTVKYQFYMQNIENELGKLSGSRYFFTFHLSHGYWQLELLPTSRNLQSSITPHAIFSTTRVLLDMTNAVTHIQSALLEFILTGLLKKFLVWLDDILLHDKTVPGILC